MSDLAIAASGVGKQYRIGAAQVRHNTLRDAIASSAGRIWSSVKFLENRREHEQFWALQDVSFEVHQGEVLGVIGRNGAGKSTLLKILSRITEPTTGEIVIRGRVGCLLEVGTGFHSELTGRENIFLNGAILGMTKSEINRKFDEIVAFAEIDRFIDTPVKHYSSGMYLRLGFAVAAHLEPEILVVDEVLAVGDVEFQKKCLGKMGDVAREGRTVLFVSHNLDAIRNLCSRCILLENGSISADEVPSEAIRQYLLTQAEAGVADRWIDVSQRPRTGSGKIRFKALSFTSGQVDPEPYPGGPLILKLVVEAHERCQVHSFGVTIRDRNGSDLVNADVLGLDRQLAFEPGGTVIRVEIDRLHLKAGTFDLTLWAGDRFDQPFDFVQPAITIQVAPRATPSQPNDAQIGGLVTCQYNFTVEEEIALSTTPHSDRR